MDNEARGAFENGARVSAIVFELRFSKQNTPAVVDATVQETKRRPGGEAESGGVIPRIRGNLRSDMNRPHLRAHRKMDSSVPGSTASGIGVQRRRQSRRQRGGEDVRISIYDDTQCRDRAGRCDM